MVDLKTDDCLDWIFYMRDCLDCLKKTQIMNL